MGLDVTAYETADLVVEGMPLDFTDDEAEDWCGNHVRAVAIDPSFHRSLRGAEDGGWYKVSGKTARVGNSYGGFNRFRSMLCRIFNGLEDRTIWNDPDQYTDRPFFELIHFADNEGTIGAEAASDLLADFETGRDHWAQAVGVEPWMVDSYDQWTEVFRVASVGGIVEFH